MKVGDKVRHKKTRRIACVRLIFKKSLLPIRLDRPINGRYGWDETDLEPVEKSEGQRRAQKRRAGLKAASVSRNTPGVAVPTRFYTKTVRK